VRSSAIKKGVENGEADATVCVNPFVLPIVEFWKDFTYIFVMLFLCLATDVGGAFFLINCDDVTVEQYTSGW
jgi:hypothetical protein